MQVFEGYSSEGDIFEDLGVGGRIITKLMFKEGDWRAWNLLTWLSVGKRGGWFSTR
jgi:hypothetical protein